MDNKKINNILRCIFQDNIETFKDEEAKSRICTFIKSLKEEDTDYEKLNYSIFVQDVHKKKWKSKALFFKVFYDEIEYAMEKYKITQNEVDFLLRLGKFLMWETNLIIDENGVPLNQKELAEKLHISTKTIQRNINSLYNKKVILKISYGNENFYMVNPYLIFTGKNINVQVPEIFILLGYESGRSNRSKTRKKVTKLNEINES